MLKSRNLTLPTARRNPVAWRCSLYCCSKCSSCKKEPSSMWVLQTCVMLPVFTHGKVGRALVWCLPPQKPVCRMGTWEPIWPVPGRKWKGEVLNEGCGCTISSPVVQANQLAPTGPCTSYTCSVKSDGQDFPAEVSTSMSILHSSRSGFLVLLSFTCIWAFWLHVQTSLTQITRSLRCNDRVREWFSTERGWI